MQTQTHSCLTATSIKLFTCSFCISHLLYTTKGLLLFSFLYLIPNNDFNFIYLCHDNNDEKIENLSL